MTAGGQGQANGPGQAAGTPERVGDLRIGVVLGAVDRSSTLGKLWRVGRAHGFLPIIRVPFCLGLGAVMGHGRQPVFRHRSVVRKH